MGTPHSPTFPKPVTLVVKYGTKCMIEIKSVDFAFGDDGKGTKMLRDWPKDLEVLCWSSYENLRLDSPEECLPTLHTDATDTFSCFLTSSL